MHLTVLFQVETQIHDVRRMTMTNRNIQRAWVRSRFLLSCRALYVTPNKPFRSSRSFCMKERKRKDTSCQCLQGHAFTSASFGPQFVELPSLPDSCFYSGCFGDCRGSFLSSEAGTPPTDPTALVPSPAGEHQHIKDFGRLDCAWHAWHCSCPDRSRQGYCTPRFQHASCSACCRICDCDQPCLAWHTQFKIVLEWGLPMQVVASVAAVVSVFLAPSSCTVHCLGAAQSCQMTLTRIPARPHLMLRSSLQPH